MKYVAFAIALIGSVPLAFVCGLSKKWLALLMSMVFVVVLKFDSMALNFISWEFYRGTSRGMEVSLAYILAFAVILSVRFKGGKIRLFPDFGAVLFVAYFLWCVVSAFSNSNLMILEDVMVDSRRMAAFPVRGGMLSFFEIWKMTMLFVVFTAVYAFLSYTANLKAVIRALAIVVVCCFFMIIKEHFSGVYQVRGPFPHQNSMALFLMLIGPVFFAAYLNLPKSRFRTLCTIAFFCASGAIFRTYSRGAMMCYPLAAAITCYQCLFRKFRTMTALRIAPIAVCALLGILALLPRIIERFESAPTQSGDTRKWLAITATNVMKTKPVTGIGVNNWSVYISTHPEAQDGAEDYRPNTRGDETETLMGIVETAYLLVGAECGYVGLALFLSWLIYYWFIALKLCHRLAGTEWFFVPAGILGGLSGCMLQSCLEWVLKQQLNFLLLVVCFAMLSWLNVNWKELKK